MDVTLTRLRDALTKAETKANRLRSQLNGVEKEAEELATAIRVLERIEGIESTTTAPPAMNENAAAILKHVGYGRNEGRAPIQIFDALLGEGRHDLNADLVRTQLWRMSKRGTLESENGRYWKPEAERPKAENVAAPDAETSEADNGTVGPLGGGSGFPPASPEGSIPSGSTSTEAIGRMIVPEDLDDDVPF